MQAEVNLIERITRAYVASRGVRWLCVLAVLLSALLLFVLAGGFPPYAWRLLAQTLPQLPALLAARGSSVLLALVGLLLLSATILIVWGALLWLSWRMLAYWRYERQELRNFAADLEEAQYQAEELDEYAEAQYADEEDFEEEPVYAQAGRASGGRNAPPVTHRRVFYPITPLPPQMQNEDYPEQARANAESAEEQCFLDDEEGENEMGFYRDEDDDDENEMDWTKQHAASIPNPPVPAQTAPPVGPAHSQPASARPEYPVSSARVSSMPAYPVDFANAEVYDQQIVEHSSKAPASAAASEEHADTIHHSSYGRILPFSAAPSAGALPHLTSTLYNRVPMPRSVTPIPAPEPAAPAQPAPQRIAPMQPVAPAQPVKAAQLPPQSAVPTQPVKAAQVPQRTVPAQPAAQSQASAPRGIPARPTTQHTAPASQSAPRPISASAKPQIAPAQAPAPRAIPAQPAKPQIAPMQPSAPRGVPAPPQARPQSAMQSLVELITTVPMTPPGREPLSIAKPLARPDAVARQAATQLMVSTGLDVGLKRRGKPNEDSLLALQNTRVLRGGSCPVGLFVVADGMGGHENGQEASHLVIQSLSKSVVPSIIYGPTDDNYSELLAEGVHHANLEVYQRNRQVKADMGTTIVAALVVDTTAYVVSAGDSRVYLYRTTSGLTQVTRDHSTVARLVESGLLKPEDVYTHPRRNEIYRSLGHHPSEDLDKFILALQPDDVLLLCSDGLWEMVRDAQIQEIIASTAHQPAQTSAALVQAALDGGGKDNISVIVVYVKAAQDVRTAWAG
jgi:serine/threonine protein phosphatase PrpC